MIRQLDLVLFENERAAAARALEAGIDGLIVDLENTGKHRRQEGADTEINAHRPEDLELGRELGARLRYCRLEGPGLWTAAEVEEVLARGATHVLLPMVRRPDEAAALLEQVAGRAAVGILVETVAAVARGRGAGAAADLRGLRRAQRPGDRARHPQPFRRRSPTARSSGCARRSPARNSASGG